MASLTGSTIDVAALQQWVGREQVVEDTLALPPAQALAATLDLQEFTLGEGDPLPLAWHWLYFLPLVPTSELAADGHPVKGGFLPPVPLPRRMWAGGSIEVLGELTLAQHIRRVSTIIDVQHKTGRNGDLVFVTLRHDLYAGEQLMLRERQDLVYRGASKPESPAPQSASQSTSKPAPSQSQWSRTMVATPPLLFRYSALTFNSHRIHYDQEYAVTKEGYADLVVQGPLCATLLLQQLGISSGGARLRRFNYTGVKPLMANSEFSLQGCIEEEAGDDGVRAQVWILDAGGAVTLRGEAVLDENG